jgi:hypothetical protein
VRQFGLYWPGLVPPDRSCLLKTALPALPALVTFATTRDGIAITRLLDAARSHRARHCRWIAR